MFHVQFVVFSVLKEIIAPVSSLISLDGLIRLSGKGLVLPFYHTVSDEDLVHVKHLYPVIKIKRFRKDLDFFQKHYKPVAYNYLVDCTGGKSSIRERAFFLSFDDGLREFHDVVAPILLERGIPATCFVNSAFVDNKEMFFRLKVSVLIDLMNNKELTRGQRKFIETLFGQYNLLFRTPVDLLKISDRNKELPDKIAPVVGVDFKEYLAVHQPYLTKKQIAYLIEQGFSIGAHSVSHPYFPVLSESEQLEQVRGCLDYLQREFGVSERLFSFPYTDTGVRKSFFAEIKKDIDLSFGTANLKSDEIPFNYQRIPMEIPGSKDARQILKSAYFFHILKQIFNKHVIYRS